MLPYLTEQFTWGKLESILDCFCEKINDFDAGMRLNAFTLILKCPRHPNAPALDQLNKIMSWFEKSNWDHVVRILDEAEFLSGLDINFVKKVTGSLGGKNLRYDQDYPSAPPKNMMALYCAKSAFAILERHMTEEDQESMREDERFARLFS